MVTDESPKFRTLLKRKTKKTPPLSGVKTSRKYIGPVQKQGSLVSTSSQAQYMPQTDQTTGGSWDLASSNWTNIGAAAANWAEVRKEIPLIGLN